METLLRIALFVGLGYASVVVLAACTQRSLLYFPDQTLPDPENLGASSFAPVTLTTDDGLALTAWYVAPRSPDRPVVVLFHGNAGTIANRLFKAVPLISQGNGLLLVEYRGYGGNPGSPSEDGLYRDGRAALRFLADDAGMPAERIVLYGESLGTGVAVQLALEAPVAALVLEAPYTSIPDVAGEHYPFLPVQWLTFDRYENKDKIGRITVPLLVIHGERDDVIPVFMGRRIYALAPEPKQALFVPTAGHNDIFTREVAETVLAFIDAYAVSPP
jgi:fermentation-respiration switch protein FrsA (DUF1100 family)